MLGAIAAIWQGRCGLAGSWQGQRLQMHHTSRWGFEGTWRGSLCLEERNINLKVFVYERSGTGDMSLATRPRFCVCEMRWNWMKLGGSEFRLWNQGVWNEGIVSHAQTMSLHCVTSCFVLLISLMQKYKICQFGHQPSGPLDLCLDCSLLSPFGSRISVILAEKYTTPNTKVPTMRNLVRYKIKRRKDQRKQFVRKNATHKGSSREKSHVHRAKFNGRPKLPG
jgi:hypothetical protein